LSLIGKFEVARLHLGPLLNRATTTMKVKVARLHLGPFLYRATTTMKTKMTSTQTAV
jgi:hypothetical protein